MLRQKRLLTVLDPLVFRAADAFLRGAPQTDRGYRKLLSRVVAAENEYQDVDLALRNIWYRSGAS